HVRIHILNSNAKSAPVFMRALGPARSSSLFPSPESRGMARRDGAPVTRVCPVGSGLVETHRSLDAPAPLGAPYAASSAICLRTSLGPGASVVRPRGWSSRETPGAVIASHARRSRIPPHRCAPARTPLGGRDGWRLAHPFEHIQNIINV